MSGQYAAELPSAGGRRTSDASYEEKASTPFSHEKNDGAYVKEKYACLFSPCPLAVKARADRPLFPACPILRFLSHSLSHVHFSSLSCWFQQLVFDLQRRMLGHCSAYRSSLAPWELEPQLVRHPRAQHQHE